MSSLNAIRRDLREQRFPLLLFTMLGLLGLNAFPFGPLHGLVVDIVKTAVLFSTMNLLLPSERFSRSLLILGVPSFVIIWLDQGTGDPFPELLETLLFALLFAVTFRLTVKELLRHFAIDRVHIFGAAAAYFLLGFFWSSVYRIEEMLAPHSFTNLSVSTVVQDLNYFSFVTLLTLGYGDIAPIHGFARISAILEAMQGQFFIAVLVGRIVGLHIDTLNRRRT